MKRDGWLKRADGGILFLDEIGELGMDEQAMLLKAIEEKRFYPLGGDYEVMSDFGLIVGTNKDLRVEVAKGNFRADLYARINIWQYTLPSLIDRKEDIAPNIEYQLGIVSRELGRVVRFNHEAYQRYVDFALSDQALWRGNFRDLSASILRLGTLAFDGRIDVGLVRAEIERLLWLWQTDGALHTVISYQQPRKDLDITKDWLSKILDADRIDVFDRLQLQAVIGVCREHNSLASAGRALFDVSRKDKKSINDSDRLRKYLAKYGIEWGDVL